ncbi:MAG TPA: type IV pilus assembly protein PilM [Gaiellaceae bacterium]|nr:type IV pilus assembly protein PilM [Gaiellaceae bacterium]
MSGISDFLKKDLSFKRKPSTKAATKATKTEAKAKTETPSAQAESTATTEETTPKKSSSKRSLSLPKRAPKQRKAPAASSGGGRHKQLVGLSIGASQLTAAVVVNNGRPKLVKAARHPLPADVVASGEVRDSEALSTEIAAFFAEADLPRKNVRLGIGSSRTGVRVFERPEVDDPKQLANAIRFRAYETLPIPIEEAMLDYHVVGDSTTADRVLLAVAYRDLVDRFAATCAAAKIELVGIDIEAFALLRAVGGEPLTAGERAEAARVAVSIGHDRTTVAVSDGRVCEFTRVLDWGGARVTAAVERALEVDTVEAEQIKQTLDIGTSDEPGEERDERTTRAAEAARREVNGLARELASSLHFYQDQPDSLGFAEITITGGGAHLQGLAEQLEELIGISVRLADPFARVGSGHGISSNGQDGALAVAIGLGIED